MVLDKLLGQLSQAQTLSALDKLLDSKTLPGILNMWLFDCVSNNFSHKTLQHYYDKTSEFLIFIGEIQPAKITDQHVQMFLNKKWESKRYQGQKNKANTVKGYYRALHRYFQFMIEKHILAVHPMEGMKPPKVPTENIVPYTASQIKTLLDNCDDSTFLGSRNKALILLFISTGLRHTEMTNIKLVDVNLTHRTIEVMGKGGKGRVVAFGTKATKALMTYFIIRRSRDKTKSPYLWLSEEGNRLGYSGVGLAIYDLAKLTGVGEIHSHIHALRHTFATESLIAGADSRMVQSLLGHTDPKMTQRYSRFVDSHVAVQKHASFAPDDAMNL